MERKWYHLTSPFTHEPLIFSCFYLDLVFHILGNLYVDPNIYDINFYIFGRFICFFLIYAVYFVWVHTIKIYRFPVTPIYKALSPIRHPTKSNGSNQSEKIWLNSTDKKIQPILAKSDHPTKSNPNGWIQLNIVRGGAI